MSARPFRLADFPPRQQRVLLSLRGTRRTTAKSTRTLLADVYADREDGGALEISPLIRALRRRLAGTPVSVCSEHYRGYWLCGAAAGEHE